MFFKIIQCEITVIQIFQYEMYVTKKFSKMNTMIYYFDILLFNPFLQKIVNKFLRFNTFKINLPAISSFFMCVLR